MRDWVHEVVDTYISDYEVKPLMILVAVLTIYGVLSGFLEAGDLLLIILGFVGEFVVAPWIICAIWKRTIGKLMEKRSAAKAADARRKRAIKVIANGHTYVFNDSFGSEKIRVSGDEKWVVSDHGNWLRMSSVRSNGKQYSAPYNQGCSLDGDIFVGHNKHEYVVEKGMTREAICAIMLHDMEHDSCKKGYHSNCPSGAVYQ